MSATSEHKVIEHEDGVKEIQLFANAPKRYDHVGAIIDFENGELDDDGIIELFQYLVDTGLAWSLQGSYGRAAQALIEQGLVTQ